MKKIALLLSLLVVFVSSVIASSALNSDEEMKLFKGSAYVSALIGLNSYAVTDEPFDALPVPVGADFSVMVTDHWGIGATMIFDKWNDYLGMYGGKYTFSVYNPSVDFTYNIGIGGAVGWRLFAGASLGYTILSIKNELGNDYKGDLSSEPFISPFLGAQIFLGPNSASPLNKIGLTLRAGWSVVGDFSGIYAAAGITFKIK